MRAFDTGDHSVEDRGEPFPLRAGLQRLARSHARSRRNVPDAGVQLLLDGRHVGTASDFAIDDSGDLQARFDLEEEMDVEGYDCEPIWRLGRLLKIVLRRRRILEDDETGARLIDDETEAQIYNG